MNSIIIPSNIKYMPDWDLNTFKYKNYGCCLTTQQHNEASAIFRYLWKNESAKK